MKKRTLYALVILMILCLAAAAIAVLYQQNAVRQLQDARDQNALLEREMELLRREKIAWDEDKARVSDSLVGVRAVLGGMLSGLEEASTALDAAASLLPTPKATPSASPKATATLMVSPSPTVIPSPSPGPTKEK